MPPLLIKNVELDGQRVDVRCRHKDVSEISACLSPRGDERVLEGHGGALIPSLRDDHLHLMAMAARRYSVQCGPPEVTEPAQLGQVLRSVRGSDWIRGVGYHESVAGDLEASLIDQWVDDRPVRIQHRSGRLWYFNSLGAKEFGLPRQNHGQLYRNDELVFERLQSEHSLEVELHEVSRELASFGVTHVTDATPSNDDATLAFLQAHCPDLRVRAMGGSDLSEGHLKIILDDYRLPDFQEFCGMIADAHRVDRPVAIHCVSRVEVVFAVSALNEVGSLNGDRLEHATELPADVVALANTLQLHIVPNPNFLYDRGDQYIQDNDPSVLDSLYPIRTMLASGIRCTGGTDAPFGDADPWRVIKAATDRRTRNGAVIGARDAIDPEEALTLLTNRGEIKVGIPANLVSLDRSWSEARHRLISNDVRLTILEGRVTFERD